MQDVAACACVCVRVRLRSPVLFPSREKGMVKGQCWRVTAVPEPCLTTAGVGEEGSYRPLPLPPASSLARASVVAYPEERSGARDRRCTCEMLALRRCTAGRLAKWNDVPQVGQAALRGTVRVVLLQSHRAGDPLTSKWPGDSPWYQGIRICLLRRKLAQ